MNITPSKSEIEILDALWEKGSATTREVHSNLKKNRDIGFTTTQKQLQRMEQKQFIENISENRTCIWKPTIQQEETKKNLIKDLFSSAFKRSPEDLVLHALGQSKLGQEEIDRIRKLLDKIEGDNNAE